MNPASDLLRPAAWVILLDGILLLLLGIVLVGDSLQGTTWVVQLGGGLLVLAGIAVGAKLWLTPKHMLITPVAWVGALAPLVLGVILLIWPKPALEAFAITVGIIVVLWGVVSTAIALSQKPRRGWQIGLVVGLVALCAGIFMLAEPQIAAFLVLVLLGIDLIVRGADRVALGHTLKKAAQVAVKPPDTETGD
jgi:uncharacterized membrane protein HdeD (DUF308 family)